MFGVWDCFVTSGKQTKDDQLKAGYITGPEEVQDW